MAVDMFLKLDGIQGESQDHKHKGEIEILSFSWGLANKVSSTGGGGGTGKPTVSDFSFVKVMDSASPQLMEGCCTGEHFPSGQITLVNKGGDKPIEYLKIKLTDILISSYQVGGSNNGGVVPMDQVTFSFNNVDVSAADKSGRFVEVSCNFQKGTTDQIGHHHE